MKKDGSTFFIEVKTRSGRMFGDPKDAVDRNKREKYGRIAEYQTLSSEKNGFYTRYKKAQIELRELRTAQQNVEAFFRKEERNLAVPQQEVK